MSVTPNPFQSLSGATRFHVSRASYFFAGPGSPANRRFNLSDVEGLPGTGPDVGVLWTPYANISLGFPIVSTGATTTGVGYVISAHAAASTPTNVPLGATHLVTLAKFPNPVVPLDVPRNLQLVSSNAGDTTQTVTCYGYDQYNQAMTETITLNGTTPVYGNKAFKYVWQVIVNTLLAGNLSVGLGTGLGLPFAVDYGNFMSAWSVAWTSGPIYPATGQTTDTGTFVAADRTIPATATTKDVYGLFTPSTTLATLTTEIRLQVFGALGLNGKINSSYGVPQF